MGRADKLADALLYRVVFSLFETFEPHEKTRAGAKAFHSQIVIRNS